MSSIARWCASKGIAVSGYDRTPSALIDELIKEGMKISFEDSLATIPDEIKKNKDNCLIIWTPALPEESIQLSYFRDQGYTLLKRSEMLGNITEGKFCIAVAGTHGKTTTSSMIAHLLYQANVPVTAFLGGLSQNYQSNFLLSGKKGKETVFVVEADEFDRSFLRLKPSIGVITSVDADHLDVYGSEDSMILSFTDFVNLIHKKGKLFIQTNANQKLNKPSGKKLKVKEYGLRSSQITAENIKAKPNSFVFDYQDGDHRITGIELPIPGYHNVENALVAIAIGLSQGLSSQQIKEGMKSFKGVKRRFEIHLSKPTCVYIDDYAHHPEEIRSLLSSVRAMYPSLKITAIFQPHLYTRTRDFAKGFSESLSLADEVILLEIYPAREKPIAGVSSEILLEEITSSRKEVIAKENLMESLSTRNLEAVITIGAGDIDRLVPEVAQFLSSNNTVSEL